MTMKNVTVEDLTHATEMALLLAERTGQPLVLAGALAMAAHGYRRETSDVDIGMNVVMGTPSGDALVRAAEDLGMTVHARHGFGGMDLRAGGVRIDVLTLDRDMPALIADAIADALAAGRMTILFGQRVHVVSLGHLFALKLMAERKKDIADVVELIKARMDAGAWNDDRSDAAAIVRRHLGWYAVRRLDDLAKVAEDELHR